MQNSNRWKLGINQTFDKQDLKDLKNIIKITKYIGETHLGLGLRTSLIIGMTFGHCAILEVGLKGVGKTTVIRAIEKWAEKQFPKEVVWNKEQTMAGADEEFNEFFSNRDYVLWTSHDLAKLSPIVQLGMLKVVSAVIEDYNCRVKTSLYDCDVRNCRLSWISSIVFDLYDYLWDIPEWRGSFVDRIVRLYCFAYGRPMIVESVPRIPKIKNKAIATVVRDDRFDEVAKMLESQFEYERSVINAERILTGLAKLCHREEVTDADYKFLNLFKINFQAELLTGSRETLTSPLEIDTEALYLLSECFKRGKVVVPELIERRRVWKENEEIPYEIAEDYPEFFLWKGDTIIAHPKFVKENMKPQLEFEKMCVKYG
jgi:hypothetical protein